MGPENLKKYRPEKLVKSNKSISRKFLTKFHFLQFQKWPKINFWTGKKFKTARNAILREKKDLFDFTIFFARTFLNFLTRCCVILIYFFVKSKFHIFLRKQVNLGRVDVVWRPITSHLLVVCQHPHLRMRQWGCEAITHLTR